jgi:hypothetical protein
VSPGRPGREAPPPASGLVRHPEGLRVAGSPPAQAPPAAAPPAAVPAQAASGLMTAREMVTRAQVSARTEPASWGSFAIRIPEPLKVRLDRRWVDDRDRLKDYELAQCHYVEAALSQIPADPDTAAAWGAEYAAAHPGREQPVTTGPRMRRDTADRMRDLKGRLQVRRTQRVRAWEVQAAAIARLLDRLDAEDGQREVDQSASRP